MENYLYFAEADVETGDDGASEAITVPASSFVGADPGNGTTTLYFKNAMGDNDGLHKVVLTHTAGKNKEVMRGVMACINAHPNKGGFINVANSNAAAVTTGTEYNAVFDGLGLSTVAITTDIQGMGTALGEIGTTLSTSYGAGMVSTAQVPQYARTRIGDSILTTVKVDLTGLGGPSDADDVVGLAAGGAAYFAKYVVAEMGILYKIDMVCLEIPASTGGNNLDDINLVSNSNATRAYNDDGSGYTQLLNAGSWTAGEMQTVASPTVAAANDYFYLTEGATHTGANTWTSGVFLFKFWGSALPTA